ncbi:hypothetical protein ABZZ80_31730 [Streptomyces sp. NPDC006356]
MGRGRWRGEGAGGAVDEAASCGAAARVEALIENMGWQISDASPPVRHSPGVSRR